MAKRKSMGEHAAAPATPMKYKLTPERQRMIKFLADRAYPPSTKGRGLGYSVFLDGLHEQPDNVLNAMEESAVREQARLRELRRFNKEKI